MKHSLPTPIPFFLSHPLLHLQTTFGHHKLDQTPSHSRPPPLLMAHNRHKGFPAIARKERCRPISSLIFSSRTLISFPSSVGHPCNIADDDDQTQVEPVHVNLTKPGTQTYLSSANFFPRRCPKTLDYRRRS